MDLEESPVVHWREEGANPPQARHPHRSPPHGAPGGNLSCGVLLPRPGRACTALCRPGQG
eukprot:7602208-Lingulodinium_polyedra.AAC.1